MIEAESKQSINLNGSAKPPSGRRKAPADGYPVWLVTTDEASHAALTPPAWPAEASRRINLSHLSSRPTKQGGLGDYCFIIYAEGHIEDELLADALRDLRSKQGTVKFLGWYPAAGAHARNAREHADGRWKAADDWVAQIRRRIIRD